MQSKSSCRRRGFKSKPSFSEKNPFHGFFSSSDLAEISYTSSLSEAGKQAGPSKDTKLQPGKAEIEIPGKLTRERSRRRDRLLGKGKARTEAGHVGESLCGILVFSVLFSIICIALSLS
jgi:hypothetical protein